MDMQQAIAAMKEARAALRVALDRLEVNDIEGEESPFMEDCENAIADIDAALKAGGVE